MITLNTIEKRSNTDAKRPKYSGNPKNAQMTVATRPTQFAKTPHTTEYRTNKDAHDVS